MSNTKFTPGPWKIRKERGRKAFNMPPSIISESPLPGHGETVCGMGGGLIHYANHEANAHLIASAPEMYEVLEIIEAAQDARSGAEALEILSTQAEDRVSQVLAKARGES